MNTSVQHFLYLLSKEFSTTSTDGGIVMALLAVTLGTALLIYYYLFNPGKPAKDSNFELLLPPGPCPWPVVGNLLLLGELPHRSLARLALKYGPLMYLRLGTTPTVIVSSAEMAKEIFRNHDQVFANRPLTLASTVLTAGNSDLVFANGSYWRHMRKMCQLELFSPKRMESFRAARAEEISFMMKSIFTESREGKPVNLTLQLWSLTANNMTRMIMNKRYFGSTTEGQREAERFRLLFENIFQWLGLFLIGDFNPTFKWVDKFRGVHSAMRKFCQEKDACFQKIIDEHRQKTTANHANGSSTPDFVDLLISMPSEDGLSSLPDSSIRAMIQDMLVAGADTAAITIEWAMAELLRQPHIIYRAQLELDAVVGNDRLVQESDIANLKFLQALVKETFRLHPVSALLLPHESSEPCNVAGYTLPSKTRLLINAWAIGRDPAIWGRSAPSFEPDRFLEQHREIDVKGQNFELLPFGSGRRGCVGLTLGLTMVQFTLAHLLHSFNWSLPNQQHPDTLDISEQFILSVRRKQPLHVLAQPRLAAHLYNL